MARYRELLHVGDDRRVGTVGIDDDGNAVFADGAARMFGVTRRVHGDVKAATLLLDGGWSNSRLYLAPEPDQG